MDEAPSFFDVLQEESKEHTGRGCDLSKAFKHMESDFAKEVKMAMNSPEVSAAQIARTLRRFEYRISEGSIRRCRRTCECWRTFP